MFYSYEVGKTQRNRKHVLAYKMILILNYLFIYFTFTKVFKTRTNEEPYFKNQILIHKYYIIYSGCSLK